MLTKIEGDPLNQEEEQAEAVFARDEISVDLGWVSAQTRSNARGIDPRDGGCLAVLTHETTTKEEPPNAQQTPERGRGIEKVGSRLDRKGGSLNPRYMSMVLRLLPRDVVAGKIAIAVL